MPRSLFGSIKDKLHSKPAGEKSFTSGPQQTAAHMPAPRINVVDEAPPAYTAQPSGVVPASNLHPTTRRSPSPAPSLASVTNDDDKYAFLSTFDTVFLIDDSGSMAGSLWRETDAVIRAITPICTSHDRDGIDIYFLNHNSGHAATADKPAGGYHGVKTPQMVEGIFNEVRPQKATPMGTRLHQILKPYVASLQSASEVEDVKPVNIIVITDGTPTDDPESVIVQHARKLDAIEAPPYQVGIQFFQVGTDAEAADFLRELDDDLGDQGVRDMVDTTSWSASAGRQQLSADGILKVVLGAVVRRLDRGATRNPGRSRT